MKQDKKFEFDYANMLNNLRTHLQESKKSRIEIPTQVYGINDYYCDNGWTLVITNQGIYLKNLTKECAKLVILETRNIKKESRAVIEEINLCKELLKEYPNIKETLISETTKEKGKSYVKHQIN